MEFANPALLAGAALASVPVILHLIMRQQPRLLEFPALRFLQARQQSNRRSLQLRHLLLLALRVAAVCLLALALARPSIHASGMIGDQEAPAAAALVFDTSPRMGYRSENKTRLQAAQEIAQGVLAQLPLESQVAIVESRGGEPSFQIDLGTARQRIDRLETTGLGRPVADLVEAALRLLKDSPRQRKEIYLFSDLAASAWSVDDPQRLQKLLAEVPTAAVYVIDVGTTDPRNLTLGEIQLSGQVLARNSPLRIVTSLTSVGMDDQRLVELYVADAEGHMQKRSEETVSVAAGGDKTIDFPLGGLEEGTVQGYARIVGEDSLPIDDVRYFTVEVKPPWKVLVAAAPPADYRAANLTEALAPADFRRNGQARFDCQVVPFAKLAALPLEEFAAVCLLDPPALAEDTWRKLGDFARAGGGLGVFLGPAADLAELNAAAAQELLPGVLAFQGRAPDGDVYLSTRNDQHPLLAKLRPRRGAIPWEDFPVYRFWQFDALTAGAATIVEYVNGRPAIVERPLGRGRVVTMTTPISELAEVAEADRWNQLWGVGAWPFFTLSNELMLYLVGSTDGQLNYFAGQAAVVRLPGDRHFPTYLLSTPAGNNVRQAAGADNTVVVTGTDAAGNYRLRAGGVGGATEGVDRGFSVNLPLDASQLARVDDQRLPQVFGDHSFRLARNLEEINRDVTLDRVGRELYPLLIALVALALGLEHVLANRFYRDRAAAEARQP